MLKVQRCLLVLLIYAKSVRRIWASLSEKEDKMELLKLLLDQAGGIAIAILLIMRIESKLDGLTSAVMKLSEVIRPEKND